MIGSGETDFGPQIEKLNKKLFTVVAWDPRGYGHSRPPDRDFPVDFFERDAKDAVDLMKTLKFKKVSAGVERRGDNSPHRGRTVPLVCQQDGHLGGQRLRDRAGHRDLPGHPGCF